MGFTWEVPAHLYLKRARVLATQFGTSEELAESLADSLTEALGEAGERATSLPDTGA